MTDKIDNMLDELEEKEGFFGGNEYEDDYGDGYDDLDDYEDDYDDYGDEYYEGMENKDAKVESDIKKAMDQIDAEMKVLEGEEGFGNMFNLDLSKNCMILIVIVLILILCKEDIMKMSFFKKLFK